MILNTEGCLLKLKRISDCGFNERSSIKISDLTKHQDAIRGHIVPIKYALDHISTFVLNNQEEINFWQTGRAIKFDFNKFPRTLIFDYKKPIKVMDFKNNLLGIGFINKDCTHLHPKLVLNAK